MQIAELLGRKGSFVATVTPDTPNVDVIRELAERKIGAMVVSDDGSNVIGIVSERDVVVAISRFGPAILESPVRMIMSEGVRTCTPSDTVDSLMATMTDLRVRHLPVIADGVLAGIVSIGDLVKTRIDELQQDRDALEQYITAR